MYCFSNKVLARMSAKLASVAGSTHLWPLDVLGEAQTRAEHQRFPHSGAGGVDVLRGGAGQVGNQPGGQASGERAAGRRQTERWTTCKEGS